MGDGEQRTLRDDIGEQLLDAASRVFARQGYEGTKIADIVREAGLSTGAVYGRFRSKNDLLREAVIRHASFNVHALDDVERVADMLQRSASRFDAPLTLDEAVRLEAHVAARREPEVASAIDDANDQWRASLDPLVRQALADGTFAPDVDSDAVLYFIRTVGLGLLVQRAAGSKAPDAGGWNELIGRILASIGAPPSVTSDPPATDPASALPATTLPTTAHPTATDRPNQEHR